jgi:hypothetical protein
MYRRAEVRAYADAVGLDRRLALARLDRALEQLTAPGARAAAAQVPTSMFARARTRVLMAACVTITAGVIALSMWASQSGATGMESPPPPTVSPSPAVVEASLPSHARPEPQPERSDEAVAMSTVESELVVITEPVGARVTVEGVGWGLTPVTIRYLSPGAKRVRVTKDGYRAEERRILIAPGGGATTLHILLQIEEREANQN